MKVATVPAESSHGFRSKVAGLVRPGADDGLSTLPLFQHGRRADAGVEIIHATNQRSLASEVGVGVQRPADRAQLRLEPFDGVQLPSPGRGRRDDVAGGGAAG